MSAALKATAIGRPAVDLVRLDLPEPPSANELFRNVSPGHRAAAKARGQMLPGRLKTEAYRTWENAAGWALNSQRPGRIDGAYEITVEAGPTNKDLGNLIKATEDFLVDHGVIRDDRLSRRIVLEDSPELPAKRIVVTVRPRKVRP